MHLSINHPSMSSTNMSNTPSITSTIKQMAGLLWYNLLSDMNKNGLSAGFLGAGGDAFQSMFLWNIAQNDFTKYDGSLNSATLSQIGGRASTHFRDGNYSQVTSRLVSSMPVSEGQTKANLSKPEALFQQASNFAKTIWPLVQQAANQLGVPAPAILAQAALETGWGSSMPGNNLFGIKASDGQNNTVRATKEVINGVITQQDAAFRNYSSPTDSVADFVQHVQSSFKTALGKTTINSFAQALQNSGYATDPNYASKIVRLADSPLMKQILETVSSNPSIPKLP